MKHSLGSSGTGRAMRVLGAMACMLTWIGHADAGTACKNDNLSKVCVNFSAQPADSVQPSGLAGPTYVYYKAVLSNAVTNTSTKFVVLNLLLSPDTGFASFSAPPEMSCTQNGSLLSCTVNKLVSGQPLALNATANAPAYDGANTASALVATATVGWQGNTSSTSTTVAVDDHAGRSFVPPNTTVTLVTEPENADPSLQTSASDPLFGKVTLPPRPEGYFASIAIIGNGPAPACVAGLFVSATDGGPYVCRDPNDPTRWIQVDVGGETFDAGAPMQFEAIWDASLMPAAQLPPTPASPTGTPPFGVFYAENPSYPPDSSEVHATGNACANPSPAPPCLTAVTRYGNNVWSASGLMINDGSNLATAGPVDPVIAFLQFLMGTANALPIPSGVIIK